MRLSFYRCRMLCVVGVILTAAAPASAQGDSVSNNAVIVNVPQLEAECSRLRLQLEKVNAEVAGLKRSNRGIRDDYRLRQKMADAEALARRLTEAETRLRREGKPAPTGSNLLATEAAPKPHDGPRELEAKADLLADQAKRLTSEAESLVRTARQIRTRQTLRSRANQLERDPFAGLESSRRNMVFAGRGAATKGASEGSGDNAVADRTGAPQGPGEGAAPQPAPSTGGSPTTTAAPGAAPPPSDQSQPKAAPSPTGLVVPTPGQATSALSLQIRTLLDPATLAEVRRLEGERKPMADAEALERAASALRQRATDLQTQSRTLRAKAKPPVP